MRLNYTLHLKEENVEQCYEQQSGKEAVICGVPDNMS